MLSSKFPSLMNITKLIEPILPYMLVNLFPYSFTLQTEFLTNFHYVLETLLTTYCYYGVYLLC